NGLYAQSDPITIERSRMTIRFVPPGPLGDLEVTSFLGDTTVVFYGTNYEIRLEEKGRVFSKKANINYESRAIAAGCGEPRSYRQSDFVEWFTGVTGGTSSTPMKINGYNACLQLSEGVFGAKDEEPTFSFSVTVPFYSLSCTGPADQKEAFLETLRSFSFYGIDPELQVPSDKEIPKGIIELADRMIFEPFEDIVDTDVVLSRDENINVEDIMNPMCKPNWIPNEASGINLGLTQTFQTTIRRDGFLALSAQAEDIDMISLSCRTLPKCGEKGENWMRYLYSPTRISWKIINPMNEVSFVQVGYLPENQLTANGENVILRPPDILLPGEVKTIRIQLKAEDIGTRSYIDSDKEELIELVFKGEKNSQGEVDIQVEVKGKVFRAVPIHQPAKETADCELIIETEKTRTLEKPVIQIPAISQSTILAWGEKLYLT
ncbi:MAG: hypothetical protein KDD63_19435, partial [Bacteroidetes bacterium]|nr:hypothetical protein [Bacteroidota bacterium]